MRETGACLLHKDAEATHGCLCIEVVKGPRTSSARQGKPLFASLCLSLNSRPGIVVDFQIRVFVGIENRPVDTSLQLCGEIDNQTFRDRE